MYSRHVLAAGLCLAAVPAAAQQAGELSLELNRAGATDDGGCQVVFVGRNGLDVGLDEVTLRLAVFDTDGVFQNLLALPLGNLASDKRRIVQFNLPTTCETISEIVVNDVAACKPSGTGEDSGICLEALSVASRTGISLGL